MNIILVLLFAAICKLCRVLLSSTDLTRRTQKTETVADEPLAEEPSPPNESTESESVSRRKKPRYVRIIFNKLFAAGEVNIAEYSPRLGLGEYSPMFTSPAASNC